MIKIFLLLLVTMVFGVAAAILASSDAKSDGNDPYEKVNEIALVQR